VTTDRADKNMHVLLNISAGEKLLGLWDLDGFTARISAYPQPFSSRCMPEEKTGKKDASYQMLLHSTKKLLSVKVKI
jgi:hypothetical protein